jgi:hypothetical protein
VDIVISCILSIYQNPSRRVCLSKCLTSTQNTRKNETERKKASKRRQQRVENQALMIPTVSVFVNFIVGDRTSQERRRIIERWNIKYEREKDDEKRKREAAEAKINFILLQQRLQENLNLTKENKDKEN